MNISRYFLSATLIFTSLFFLSSCRTIETRGKYVDPEDIQKIEKGRLSQPEVEELLGTPNYIPEYSKNNWYYIQRSLSKRAWFDEKLLEQKIVKINFNPSGRAEKIELLTEVPDETITPRSNYTPTKGTEETGIQKFVKNVGRFTKTPGKKKKKQK